MPSLIVRLTFAKYSLHPLFLSVSLIDIFQKSLVHLIQIFHICVFSILSTCLRCNIAPINVTIKESPIDKKTVNINSISFSFLITLTWFLAPNVKLWYNSCSIAFKTIGTAIQQDYITLCKKLKLEPPLELF